MKQTTYPLLQLVWMALYWMCVSWWCRKAHALRAFMQTPTPSALV